MSQENNFVPEQENYKPLSPFKMFVKSNFPFIEATYEALDNYGLYCKVVEYLNNVIENENTVENNVTALYNAFVSLNAYVSNYFDNLDVQEEINNKLDNMAQDGTLYQIIRAYTDPIVEAQNNRINGIDAKVTAITNGSPLVATSTSQMTDTTKIYVLTTDGYWYYYNGSAWTRGGIYQSSGIGNGQINYKMTDFVELDSKNYIVLNDRTNTYYGVAITEISADGTITLNGECTQNQSLGFGVPSDMKTLKAGSYTFDVCKQSGEMDSQIAVAVYGTKVSDNTSVTLVNRGVNQLPYTFTIAEDVRVSSMSFWIVAQRNLQSYIIKPQLQKGTSITEVVTGKQYKFKNSYFENYFNYLLDGHINPENTDFAFYDKTNYLLLKDETKTVGGITSISNSKSGILELNGTCTDTQALGFGDALNMRHLDAGTYTFDIYKQSGQSENVGVTIYAKKVSDDTSVTLVNIGIQYLPQSFTVTEELYITAMSFWITSGRVFDHWKIFPQIQKTSRIIQPVSAKNVLLDSNYVNFLDVYNDLVSMDKTELLLCNKLRSVNNKELSIYYGNILRNAKTNQVLQTYSTSLTNYNDCYRIKKETQNYTENLKIEMNNIIKNTHEKQITLNVVASDSGSGTTKKCLFIGDSMTNAGVYTQKLLDLFSDDAMSIELIGTRGTSPNLHEGRNSWSAYSYTHSATYGELANPFWNEDAFDFSYYMENNNFSNLDIVGIMLGTNDFGIIGSTIDEYVENLQTIIDSIHDYDPNIEILLMTPPSVCQIEPYFFSWINSINRATLGIIQNFENEESNNIYICPIHYNVDPLNDFTTETEPINEYSEIDRVIASDYIHPANIGYYHMSDMLYCYIKYLGTL